MKPRTPRAWIISIGTELLVGRIVNTNATRLSRRLTFMGFNVERIIAVPDVVGDIVEEIRRGLGRANLIVTTGGLGPTHDDVTMEALAVALGRELVLNKEAESMLRDFYSRRGLNLTRERLKMAYMPDGCRPLRNPVGSAPGCIIAYGDTLIVTLPGVPEEMEAMFESEVVKLIAQMTPTVKVVECSMVVKGVPEASIAPTLREVAARHERVYVKSHPKGFELGKPVIEIIAMASGDSEDEALRRSRVTLEILASKALELGGEVGNVHCT